MENMSEETIRAITEYYEDKDLVKDILYYLYNISTDSDINRTIEDWFDTNDYCIDCGSKLEFEEVADWHSEVQAYEYYTERFCPCCDKKGEY